MFKRKPIRSFSRKKPVSDDTIVFVTEQIGEEDFPTYYSTVGRMVKQYPKSLIKEDLDEDLDAVAKYTPEHTVVIQEVDDDWVTFPLYYQSPTQGEIDLSYPDRSRTPKELYGRLQEMGIPRSHYDSEWTTRDRVYLLKAKPRDGSRVALQFHGFLNDDQALQHAVEEMESRDCWSGTLYRVDDESGENVKIHYIEV